MNCPHCSHPESKVASVERQDIGDFRTRECRACKKTFRTRETVVVYAGKAAGYFTADDTQVMEEEVAAAEPEPSHPPRKKAAKPEQHVAHLNDAGLALLTPEAQPLVVEWWNVSRRHKHGSSAAWSFAAFQGSVHRLEKLPPHQQVLLAQAGVEHGWQALKPEYVKEELAKPTANGRPMPKDPAMLAALESWPR